MSSMLTKLRSGLSQLVAADVEGGDPGPVVALGSTNADAAPLPFDSNNVTGADGTKGVILIEQDVNSTIRVYNNAAAILKVYPPAGGSISGLTATTGAFSVAANKGAVFHKTAAGVWGGIGG